MQFLTDFGDQGLTLPLSLTVAIAFAASGWRRGALAWVGVVVGTLGCLAVLKVLFMACGWRWTSGQLSSPSGHTASAALLYGGFCLLLLRPRGPWRHATLLIPLLFAALVGLSRVLLHYHTVVEVIGGGLVGTIGAALLPRLAGPPPPLLSLRRVLAPIVLVLVLLHGGQLQAEVLLRSFVIEGLWPPASCAAPSPRGAVRGQVE